MQGGNIIEKKIQVAWTQGLTVFVLEVFVFETPHLEACSQVVLNQHLGTAKTETELSRVDPLRNFMDRLKVQSLILFFFWLTGKRSHQWEYCSSCSTSSRTEFRALHAILKRKDIFEHFISEDRYSWRKCFLVRQTLTFSPQNEVFARLYLLFAKLLLVGDCQLNRSITRWLQIICLVRRDFQQCFGCLRSRHRTD